MFLAALLSAVALPSGEPAPGRAIVDNVRSAAVPGLGGRFPPLAQRTGKSPTGYQVTFRYWAPAASSVRIEGEWYFSSPSQTTMASSQGLLPTEWRPGDFPIAYPNSTARNWPVTSMSYDHRTGLWSYTTPLPSGVFTYGFYVNCPSPGEQGCAEVSDPSNPPWNDLHGAPVGSVEASSQVYVPPDPVFGTVGYWWQGPARAHGTLVDLAYPSSPAKQAADADRIAVYTPPGYDRHRAIPYPTLYLSHGGPGNEVDWTTRGDAANILDNLIATGKVKPLVVVMTNFNGFAFGCEEQAWATDYEADLADNVIPFVQGHYDVSRHASRRAFAGLSCGAYLANSLLLGQTAEFGYYGVMSPFPTFPAVSPSQVTALKRAVVLVGAGRQDPLFPFAVSEVAGLQRSGVRALPDFLNGGHEWYVWRILLRDFLTKVAFSPSGG
jgi:enterochelin esterase-like enzyme